MATIQVGDSNTYAVSKGFTNAVARYITSGYVAAASGYATDAFVRLIDWAGVTTSRAKVIVFSSGGVQLGISNELTIPVALGWVTATFPTAVPISAGQTYYLAVIVNSGTVDWYTDANTFLGTDCGGTYSYASPGAATLSGSAANIGNGGVYVTGPSVVRFGDNVGNDFPGTDDTKIREVAANSGFGADDHFEVTKWTAGDFTHSLIRFNAIAGNIPANATITNAILRFFLETENGGTRTIEVRRLLRTWVEPPTNFNSPASWNDYAPVTTPVVVDYQQSNWSDNVATDEVTPTVTWLAGDYILVVGAVEDSGYTISTPTATGLTFTALGSPVGGASDTHVYMWSALAAGNGSSAVTGAVPTGAPDFSAAKARGIAVLVYRSCGGFGTPASIVGANASVISLTRTRANSCVVTCMADWSQANDVAVTPSPTGTQRIAQPVAGKADFFVMSFPGQGAAGTTNYGHTAGAATVDMTGLAVEVLGITSPWGTAGGTNATDRSSTVSGSVSTATADASTYVQITGAGLIADVQGFVDGSLTNNGWHCEDGTTPPADSRLRIFTSSEGVSGQRPYLEVTYTTPPPPPAPTIRWMRSRSRIR